MSVHARDCSVYLVGEGLPTTERAKLYYRDLLAIEKIFSDSFECVDIAIDYLGDEVPYKGDTLTGLSQSDRSRDLSYLRIEVRDSKSEKEYSSSYLAFKATSYSDLELRAENPTDKIAGLFAKIDNYIKKYERPYLIMLQRIITPVPYLFFPGLIILNSYIPSDNFLVMLLYYACLVGAIIIIGIMIFMLTIGIHNKKLKNISLEDRPKSLLSEKSIRKLLYDLALLLIGALLGALFT